MKRALMVLALFALACNQQLGLAPQGWSSPAANRYAQTFNGVTLESGSLGGYASSMTVSPVFVVTNPTEESWMVLDATLETKGVIYDGMLPQAATRRSIEAKSNGPVSMSFDVRGPLYDVIGKDAVLTMHVLHGARRAEIKIVYGS